MSRYSATSGELLGSSSAEPDAKFINYGAPEGGKSLCSATTTEDPLMWADDSYQPITRWEIAVHSDL
ncbi:MAG: hypothetical protein CME06_07580 [Gemmatimonadetes bacterium]|nr:hypothetical protein [Gemmatimonadota bacterium]